MVAFSSQTDGHTLCTYFNRRNLSGAMKQEQKRVSSKDKHLNGFKNMKHQIFTVAEEFIDDRQGQTLLSIEFGKKKSQ